MARAVALLLLVEGLDELFAGTLALGAGEIKGTFDASYTEVSAAMLFVPALIALVLEPFLFVWADRLPRRWFLAGGTALMGMGGLMVVWAPSLTWVAIAVSLGYLGSGAGVALGQATLVDLEPEQAEQALARWTLAGELGDLLAPALLVALALLGAGFHAATACVSLLILSWSVLWLLWGAEPTSPSCEEEEEPPFFDALRSAFSNGRLVAWLGAVALCDLLDDMLVVFAVLHLEHVGLSTEEIAFVMGAGVLGAVVGALVLSRLLETFNPMRVLWMTSLLCAVAFGAWLFTTTVAASAAWFFLVGLGAAPMYPITMARAYKCLPGKSGTVNAVGHLYAPLGIAVPLALGVGADMWGVGVALGIVLAQPVGLFFVGLMADASVRRR